ncbi:MAG TPA: hypothetical protein PLA54_08715 [Spirochaetota bacterium]|nr:hypothetical protein [Spirochaetota bacterium]HQE59257.1 hypothetical protein [Spirochaetota bacterium]
MSGKKTNIEEYFNEISEFASSTSRVGQVSPLESLHDNAHKKSFHDIDKYVSEIEDKSFTVSENDEEEVIDIPEILDIDTDFIRNEIINISRDFIIKVVGGIKDANPSNLIDLIKNRNKAPENKSKEEVAVQPSVAKEKKSAVSSIDDIGYNVINISDMSEEEYIKRFYPEDSAKSNKQKTTVVDDDKYHRIETGSEHFIDLDLLFGLPSSGFYTGSKKKNISEYEIIEDMKLESSNEKKTEVPPVTEVRKFADKLSDQIKEMPSQLLIEPIDLAEAEKIAREDIFLLSEEDLIEELEQMDLTPLDELTSENRLSEGKKKLRSEIFSDLNQLSNAEFEEIENDISSNKSVIIEENIEDIKTELVAMNLSDKKDSEEEIADITDRIVFLDDENSLNGILSGMGEKKSADMKKLLAYLDGLFEKLPEDTVKKFAGSEYFDLYIKVLNDLGV